MEDKDKEYEQMRILLEQSKIMSDTFLKGQKIMRGIVYASLGIGVLTLILLILCITI